MKIIATILRSIIFSILAIPTLAVVVLTFNLSTNKLLSLRAAYEFVVRKANYAACLDAGFRSFSMSCLTERSYMILLAAVAVGLAALFYSLFEKIFSSVWLGRKLVSLISFSVLILPVLYYVVLYLPSSWDANDPVTFIFMFSLVTAHIVAVSILQWVYSLIFRTGSL